MTLVTAVTNALVLIHTAALRYAREPNAQMVKVWADSFKRQGLSALDVQRACQWFVDWSSDAPTPKTFADKAIELRPAVKLKAIGDGMKELPRSKIRSKEENRKRIEQFFERMETGSDKPRPPYPDEAETERIRAEQVRELRGA